MSLNKKSYDEVSRILAKSRGGSKSDKLLNNYNEWYDIPKNEDLTLDKEVELLYNDGSDIGSRMYTIEQDWGDLKGYSIYNGIMWIIIGIIICFLNVYLEKETLADPYYLRYCCDCYQLSKTYPKANSHAGIDWSYCINDCTCNYCQNVSSSFNATIPYAKTCSIGNERLSHKDCDKNLSYSVFRIFKKSYIWYGVSCLAVTFVYGIVILCFLSCGKDVVTNSVRIFMYNLVVAIICFYCLFKRYQYYGKKFPDHGNIVCRVNSIDYWAEKCLDILIYTSMALISIPWILLCTKCCCNKSKYRVALNKVVDSIIIMLSVIIMIIFLFGIIAAVSKIIYSRFKKSNEIHTIYHGDPFSKDTNYILIILMACIMFKSVDIFFKKFFRSKFKEQWKYRATVSVYNEF